MSIFRNMAVRLAGILFVVSSLSGCGGGGGGGSAAVTVNPADVVGTWKMASFTPSGGNAIDMTPYNLSLVSDAATYTYVAPMAIPGGHAACAEYGTWSVSGNSMTTTPIVGSTCGNGATTYINVSVSGSTMTMSDASGTYVYQKQAATPVTSTALTGSWKMMAKDKAGTVTALNQSNVTLNLGSTTYTLTGIGCSESGTWSVSASALNFVPAAGGTCGNSVAYTESASLNDPLVTLTDAVAITIWEKLPAAPASPVATGTNGAVSLSWQAVSGATSYKVYRATTSGALASKTVITTTASTSYQDTTAVAGTTYYYQITAVSAVGESLPSTEVNGVATAPPSPVTGLTGTPGTAQAILAWNAVTGATSYNVYYKTANIGMCVFTAPNMGTGDYSLTGWTKITGATPITTAGTTIINVTTGVCYSFMVTAVNAYGESLSMHYVDVTPN